MKKIRVTFIPKTYRITDCQIKIIQQLDAVKIANNLSSRADAIAFLWGYPIECKEDIKDLKRYVNAYGFKTIESWLEDRLNEYEQQSED